MKTIVQFMQEALISKHSNKGYDYEADLKANMKDGYVKNKKIFNNYGEEQNWVKLWKLIAEYGPISFEDLINKFEMQCSDKMKTTYVKNNINNYFIPSKMVKQEDDMYLAIPVKFWTRKSR